MNTAYLLLITNMFISTAPNLLGYKTSEGQELCLPCLVMYVTECSIQWMSGKYLHATTMVVLMNVARIYFAPFSLVLSR